MFELRRRPLRLVSLLALLGSTACNDGGSNAEVVDAALVDEVRDLLTTAGVGPVSAPTLDEELVELGRALFFDPLLSGNQDVSCATCHFPDLSSADGRCLPGGVGGAGLGPARTGGDVVPRNSPMVLNAHLSEDLFWDGRVDRHPDGSITTPAGAAFSAEIVAAFTPGLQSLASQAMLPPTSRAEMRGQAGENELADVDDADVAAIWSGIVDRVTALPAYRDLLTAAYPGTTVDDWNMGHLGNAIAAFEATDFARFDSPFQRFLEGDDAALGNQALRGARAFYTNAGCVSCHSGSDFSDGRYHNIALPQWGPGKGDGAGGADDFGRERVTGNDVDRYRFRTPSLLNVELTAPYGRLGQYSTLEAIVDHYRNPADRLRGYDATRHADDPSLLTSLVDNTDAVIDRLAPQLVDPDNFNEADVVAFLRALTADSARDMSSITPDSVPSGLAVDSF